MSPCISTPGSWWPSWDHLVGRPQWVAGVEVKGQSFSALSGCGKTTLLDILTGRRTTGQIEVCLCVYLYMWSCDTCAMYPGRGAHQWI